MIGRLGERLHRRPRTSLLVVVIATVLALRATVPLRFDFSFTSLFVGEGQEYDRLRDYLRRFGADVNFVMIAVEAPDLFSAERMARLRELSARLERLEGVDRVVSPTNVTDLVGDGGSLGTRSVVPDPLPEDDGAWGAIRTLATGHPLHSGTVFSEDGTHAAIFVRYGLETEGAACSDGVDNDGDGDVDCRDTSCREMPDCRRAGRGRGGPPEAAGPRSEADPARCTNGADDDGDGRVDCADPDCAEQRACAWSDMGLPRAEADAAACSNGVDDDGDGAVDCADPDCVLSPLAPACDTTRAISAIVAELDAEARRDGWGALHIGGVPVVSQEYTRVIQHDLRTYLPLTAALVSLVLLALFRSTRGVLLPMATVAVGVAWAMGALMATGGTLNMINSSMPTLLLVIGIADAVHIVSRYLEEAPGSRDAADATRRTMRHMAAACLLTSVTSAVGFASLASAHLPIIRNFGLHTALGIMLAYVAAMLLIPAGLALLPLPDAREIRRSHGGDRFAHAVTSVCVALVTRHRRRTVVGLLVGGAACVLGVLQVDSNTHLMAELREDNPLSVSGRVIEEHHGGVLSGAIVFRAPPDAFAEPQALREMEALSRFAEDWRWETGERLVSRAFSLADVVEEAHAEYRGDEAARTIPETRAAVVSLLDQVPADQREAMVSADYGTAHVTFRMLSIGSKAWAELRQELEERIDESPSLASTDWYFTGSSTLGQDAMGFMTRDLLSSLGLAVLIIMVLMSLLFRSPTLGAISMIPNAFPLLVTMAVVGFSGIDIRVSTAVVFSVSLGIAVDDTIHVLVRFREELSRPGTTYEAALERAIRGAGRAVVFTTAMLCIGFGMLAMSEFTAVRELGLLGAVTLVSALVGDLVVLPLVLLAWRPRVRVG